jgi:mannose-6-phosphate isomerase class I
MSYSSPFRVIDELIEQPSWGGRYIIDLKGLSSSPRWLGKRVGQSYELAADTTRVETRNGEIGLNDLIAVDPAGVLGEKTVKQYGGRQPLLIKLTQAKGNSFQVHLPEGKTLGGWKPKPEAWFYLGPGLFTFGLKQGKSFEAYSHALIAIDERMRRLSAEVKSGLKSLEAAKAESQKLIAELNPHAYVNMVTAAADDIVDLTAGGIHHSWEEDNARFPDGNLVYEVQVDVQDEYCSMRGFDKGKFLSDGSVRRTHVRDYLVTLDQDERANDVAAHVGKPRKLQESPGVLVESVFRTPYFNLDRLTLSTTGRAALATTNSFHHLFVFKGDARIGKTLLLRGQSYIVPANAGSYHLEAADDNTVVLLTSLP